MSQRPIWNGLNPFYPTNTVNNSNGGNHSRQEDKTRSSNPTTKKHIPTENEYFLHADQSWGWGGNYKTMMALRYQSAALASMSEGVMPACNGADIVYMIENHIFQLHARFRMKAGARLPELRVTTIESGVVAEMEMEWKKQGRKDVLVQTGQIGENFRLFASDTLKRVLSCEPWVLYALCLLIACFDGKTNAWLRNLASVHETSSDVLAPGFHNRSWAPWDRLALLSAGKIEWKTRNEQK